MLWVEMGRQYWDELQLKVWLWWGEDRDRGHTQTSPLERHAPSPDEGLTRGRCNDPLQR